MKLTDHVPVLTGYDVVLINSSAGKDSEAMLGFLVELADAQGCPRDRMIVVHADLGRVEHPGTRELAQRQAEIFGLRFEVVGRDEQLLEQVQTRRRTQLLKGNGDQRAWPSSMARYCTSDQKTAQVAKLMTRLVREQALNRPVRILNCLGIRAQESPARALKASFGVDLPASNGKRAVDRWLPIFHWTEDEVWAYIRETGLPYHPAYDAGMPRLSCAFCVLAGKDELVIAAGLYPELAAEYIAVEDAIGQPFQLNRSMREVVAEAATDTEQAA